LGLGSNVDHGLLPPVPLPASPRWGREHKEIEDYARSQYNQANLRQFYFSKAAEESNAEGLLFALAYVNLEVNYFGFDT
jgi:hypothetical protein